MSDPYGARLVEVILVGDQGVWKILEKGLNPGDPWIIERWLPAFGEAALYWPNKDFSGNGYDEEHGIIVRCEEGAMEEGWIVKNGVWEREK